MRLQSCVSCSLPVMELEGQFEKLDLLYVNAPIPPPETVGWWHVRCLVESDAALPWYEGRLSSLRDVRGYHLIAEYPHWSVVREPRSGEVIALGRGGEVLSLSLGSRKRARASDGGWIYPIFEQTCHLELDDEDLVRSIQEGLQDAGSYSLPVVLKAMGVADKVVHPEALERGMFRLDKELQLHWGIRFVSASVDYGVFVPTQLESHVGESLK